MSDNKSTAKRTSLALVVVGLIICFVADWDNVHGGGIMVALLGLLIFFIGFVALVSVMVAEKVKGRK